MKFPSNNDLTKKISTIIMIMMTITITKVTIIIIIIIISPIVISPRKYLQRSTSSHVLHF